MGPLRACSENATRRAEPAHQGRCPKLDLQAPLMQDLSRTSDEIICCFHSYWVSNAHHYALTARLAGCGRFTSWPLFSTYPACQLPLLCSRKISKGTLWSPSFGEGNCKLFLFYAIQLPSAARVRRGSIKISMLCFAMCQMYEVA